MCLTSVQPGAKEPFQCFVARLQETVSSTLGSSYAADYAIGLCSAVAAPVHEAPVPIGLAYRQDSENCCNCNNLTISSAIVQ